MLNQKQPKVPKNHQEQPPLQVPGVGVPEVGSKVKSLLRTLMTLLVVVRKLARALVQTLTADRKNRRRNQLERGPRNLRLKKPPQMKR